MQKQGRAGCTALFLFLAFGACGCGREVDTAELELLVKDDPAYSELVQVKQVLKGQIAGIRKGLDERRRDTDQKVWTLRQTFEADRQSKEQVINELNARLKAQKQDFEAGFFKVKHQLEARVKMKADIQKAIQEAQGVLNKKDKLAITGKEIGEWEARIQNLQARLAPLELEISDLQTAVSLKKKKLKYL